MGSENNKENGRENLIDLLDKVERIGIPSLSKLALETKISSLVLQGRYEEALDCADKLLEQEPTNAYALETKIEILSQQGKYEEALEVINNLIKLNPNEPNLWILKGRIVLFTEGREEALNCIEKALWISPKNPLALSEKILLLEELERLNDALTVANVLVNVAPNDTKSWELKGHILAVLGNDKEALKCFNHALKLNATNFAVIYERSKLLRKLGKYKEALEDYKLLLKLDPANAELWLKVGSLNYTIKDYQKALECYDYAIRLKIEEKTTSKKLNRIPIEPDTKQLNAKEQLMKAFYFKVKGLSDEMFSLDWTEKAMKYVSEHRDVRDRNVQDWYTRGTTLYALGCYYEASNCFRRVVTRKPKFIEAWLGLILALFMNQDIEDATRALMNAVKINPSIRDKYKDKFQAAIDLIDVYKKIYLQRLREKEAGPHLKPI